MDKQTEIVIAEIIKHLPGRHDQLKHAGEIKQRVSAMSDRELQVTKLETEAKIKNINAKLNPPYTKDGVVMASYLATSLGLAYLANRTLKMAGIISTRSGMGATKPEAFLTLAVPLAFASLSAANGIRSWLVKKASGVVWGRVLRGRMEKVLDSQREILGIIQADMKRRRLKSGGGDNLTSLLQENVKIVADIFPGDPDMQEVTSFTSKLIDLLIEANELESELVQKHFPGKHNQRNHAGPQAHSSRVANLQTSIKNMSLSLREWLVKRDLSRKESPNTVAAGLKIGARNIAIIGTLALAVTAYTYVKSPGLKFILDLRNKMHKDKMEYDEDYRADFAKNITPGASKWEDTQKRWDLFKGTREPEKPTKVYNWKVDWPNVTTEPPKTLLLNPPQITQSMPSRQLDLYAILDSAKEFRDALQELPKDVDISSEIRDIDIIIAEIEKVL